MRKSGLHKQISSIFDGVPVPQNSVVAEMVDPSATPMQPQDMIEPENREPEAPVRPASAPSGASLVKRLTANPSECASTPSVQVGRPMPLPKSAVPAAVSGPGFSAQIRKALFGSAKGSLDARQKKMAALVGILSIVFGTVLFVSLGGVGNSQAVAAEKQDDAVPQAVSPKKAAEDWTLPAPLPADLRDATSPVAVRTNVQSEQEVQTGDSELVVKGIVFSKTKPSAIINDKILTQGDSVNGSTIVNITRDAVEFEANGKHWTQTVQR